MMVGLNEPGTAVLPLYTDVPVFKGRRTNFTERPTDD